MKFLRTFEQLGKNDVAIAGGKGASLGEMTQIGIPVPSGFLILTSAFEKILEQTDLNVEIEAILDSVNHKEIHAVENASEKIKALILEAEMPKDIAGEIQKFFKNLGAKYVAVRSSATAEDSASAAWAGQLESYLNTREENLLENIKKCWASLFTPRAIFYRFEKDLHKQRISVAVVVQKMVGSEKSGIAFSVHPVTQNRNQIIIEAGFGLGEAIVSGQITPDNYVVEKQPRRIIDKNIQTQLRGLYRAENGGNEWRDVPKEVREKQTLSDEEILDLSKLIIDIENHYSFPCDIEWAFEKGRFYILQSRPITTLMDIRITKNRDNKSIKRVFKKIFNRYMPIYAAQYSYIGKSEVVLKVLENAASFPPLFINKPGKGASVYYELEVYESNSKRTLEYFKKNPNAMKKISDDYRKIYNDNVDFIENANVDDIKRLFDLNAYRITPLITILILVGREEYDKELKDVAEIARDTRYWNDKILYITGIKIFELINKKFCLDDDTGDYITIEEALSDILPPKEEIEKRRRSWVMINDKTLYTGNKIKEFLDARNIIIKEDVIVFDKDLASFKGRSAQNGHVRGMVKTVFTMQDVEKVNDGEIIVSPMTGPDFMLAIKKAAAIITDEGGITCHAAIIARELKKPCIIGTKIATEVLKDGDFVEVDADNGVVRILK